MRALAAEEGAAASERLTASRTALAAEAAYRIGDIYYEKIKN